MRKGFTARIQIRPLKLVVVYVRKFLSKQWRKFFKFLEKDKQNLMARKSSWIFSTVVVVLLVVMGVIQIIRVRAAANQQFAVGNSVAMAEEKIQSIEATRGSVLGIQIENENAGVLLASQNFSIKELKFGGDVSLLANSYENVPLKVADIRSEVIATKDKSEMKLLVYWKTNKLAVSRIEFSKMNMGNPKKIEEKDFGFSHSVILPHLEPSTAYTYVITVEDNWGNIVTSDKYSTYTGAKEGSVIDLIMNTMKSTFSWALKE